MWHARSTLAALCMAWACVPSMAMAQAAPTAVVGPSDGVLSHERELEAIRRALLQTTLESPMQVRSQAWMDDQGQLQESTQFTSGARVRGVRVQAYADAMNGQDFDVQVQVAPAALPVGVVPDAMTPDMCAARSARWRQRMAVQWQWGDGWQPMAPAEQAQLQRSVSQLWASHAYTAQASQRWLWQAPPTHGATPYERALRSNAPQASHGQAVLSVAVVQPQATPTPLLSVSRLNPWKPVSVQPSPLLRWRLHMQWHASGAAHTFEWDMPLQYGPLSLDGGMGHGTFQGWQLPRDAAAQLDAWLQWMAQHTACDVVAYPVLQHQGQWQIQADTGLGVRPGDRFLIVDRASVPQRMLEPGVLSSMAIAQVQQADGQWSQIQWLAGPTPGPGADWVALPL